MTETPLVVPANEIRPGDFLDVVEPNLTLRGPRGGRYRFDGVRVESRIVRCGWIDEYRHERGYEIVPSTGVAFRLPGNVADLTTARVRRSFSASAVGSWLTDDDLLALAESDNRAEKLAALAELDRRTR